MIVHPENKFGFRSTHIILRNATSVGLHSYVHGLQFLPRLCYM